MPKIHASVAVTPSTEPVSEQHIRTALLDALREKASDNERVQEELRLDRGIARIDVAVIGKTLVGYEIKSDADSFARFANQIHAYNRVFDEIHLVCGPRHIEAAVQVVPSWWGLSIAQRNANGKVCIKSVRKAKANGKQDSFSLASMLWREEALAMIEGRANKVPAKASAHALWEHIASSFPLESIRETVADTLLRRQLTAA